MGLVILVLVHMRPSTYFQPDELLHRVLLMPQLQILWIGFVPSDSSNYAQRDTNLPS